MKEKVNLLVIPLRDDSVFPGTEKQIPFGRKRSIDTIIAASKESKEGYLLVVSQKDDTVNDPKVENLYNIGTVCKYKIVKELEKEEKMIVVFTGISRFKVDSYELKFMAGCEVLTAVGETVVSQNDEGVKKTLLLTELSKLVSEYNLMSLSPSIPYMKNHFHKEELEIGDLIADKILPTLEKRQAFLEEFDSLVRLEMLIEEISFTLTDKKEKEIIQKKAMKNLERSQKEMILREQMKVIQNELGNQNLSEKDKILKKIEAAGMPQAIFTVANDELNRLSQLHPQASEYNVVKNYLEWLTAIPWNRETKDNVKFETAVKLLEKEHHGLNEPKERILEFLAINKVKKNMRSPIICLQGPPGVGKTSLGKSIAKSLGREFARISLGGVRDEAEIRGHRRTYVGAMPGKIAQTLKKVGVNNPVILLDEIDKMASGNQGDPAAAMLEVLDPEQNNTFTDHYLDVPLDLSKVLFVCTSNVLENIPAPLRDRMEIIYVSGYTTEEKFNIAKKHLIPDSLEEVGLKKNKFLMNDESIRSLIEDYTMESGVRELQRKVSALVRSSLLKNLKTKKKIEISEENLKDFLGAKKFGRDKVKENSVGTSVGLAWTSVGGSTLNLEATAMPGSGRVILTGSLGEVIKESAQIALSYIKTNKKDFNFNKNLNTLDLHLHFPAGATPKDGPSAGITIFSCLISLFKNKAIKDRVAMTGELSLTGDVLAVGGIKEKIIAAHRQKMTKVLIPYDNASDLEKVPEEIKKDLEIILVKNAKEVFNIIF